jgi:hypothetical protein
MIYSGCGLVVFYFLLPLYILLFSKKNYLMWQGKIWN